MRISPAKPSDLAAVLALWQAADAEPSVTDDLTSLDRLLRFDPGALLLARDDEHLLGSLIATWDGWRGAFYRLVVHPDQRRRGIATALVRAGEQRLDGLGVQRLALIMVEQSRHARAFWQALGYEEQPDRVRGVKQLTR